MTTQFAVKRGLWTHYNHNIFYFPINNIIPIKLSFCVHQGYQSLLRATWFSSQVARQIIMSFQRWSQVLFAPQKMVKRKVGDGIKYSQTSHIQSTFNRKNHYLDAKPLDRNSSSLSVINNAIQL